MKSLEFILRGWKLKALGTLADTSYMAKPIKLTILVPNKIYAIVRTVNTLNRRKISFWL